jgi:chemotaxis protein CheX
MARKQSKSRSKKPPTAPRGKTQGKSARGAKKMVSKPNTAIAEPQDREAIGSVVQQAVLTLPECLDSGSVIALRDTLLTYRGSPLEVDAGQVRRTGTQALQILISAARTWRADGQRYALTHPSSEFLDTLALVGVAAEQLSFEGISQ